MSDLWVAAVAAVDGQRQIGPRRRPVPLAQRAADVKVAIAEVTELLTATADDLTAQGRWRVTKVESTFGLSPMEGGGIYLSDGGASSLTVTVTLETSVKAAPEAADGRSV